jgi:hypothetical protein
MRHRSYQFAASSRLWTVALRALLMLVVLPVWSAGVMPTEVRAENAEECPIEESESPLHLSVCGSRSPELRQRRETPAVRPARWIASEHFAAGDDSWTMAGPRLSLGLKVPLRC